MRKIKDLKRIIRNLPLLDLHAQQILIEDLMFLKQTFSESLQQSSYADVKDFLDDKLKSVELALGFVKARNFSQPEALESIQSLYAPIYENFAELTQQHTDIPISRLLMEELNNIKRRHPLGDQHDINGFIELLLYEKVVEYSRNQQ